MGAVVPILVLSYLSDPLGAILAYLVSALIPVGWVLVDLLFVTRRFNFITGFLGLSAIVLSDGGTLVRARLPLPKEEQ